MYANILKRDLKRKKTMNVILLIFVLLSAMFMASSVNNIIAVTSGLDYFFEKADMSDYIALESGVKNSSLEATVGALDSVTDCRKEPLLLGVSSDVKVEGSDKEISVNSPLYLSIDNAQLNYFNQDNEIITEVEKGKVYIGSSFASQTGLKIGDKLTLTIGETPVELEYMGKVKDAALGSSSFGNPRFIMNDEDYQLLCNNDKAPERAINAYYIDTTDTKEVKEALSNFEGITLSEPQSTFKTTYIMEMMVAGILLVVSIFLIVVSFVVLKHTIGFTIAEEFREIGVMKAIGMKNSSIRGLYLVKYLAITVVGSALGFFLSIPFSDMLLKSVSTSMYLSSENNILVGLLAALLVVGITLFFSWISTGKIKKLTPVDAVRNGTTGERFRKKSLMHLSKSKLGSNIFLATNDIVSAPKKYSVITAVFAILIMLVMVLANTANTLKSEATLPLLGCVESDLYIDAQKLTDKSLEDIEKILEDNNMPGTVHREITYGIGVVSGDTKTNLGFVHNTGTKASDYVYGEGVAPECKNEVALSYLTAEELGLGVGDTITLLVDGEKIECTVTALFQTMNSLGKANRLHEEFDVSTLKSTGSSGVQIDFDDELTKSELQDRTEKLKDILGTEDVMDTAEFTKRCTGVYDTMVLVKNMVLIIVLAIVALIAVLMERSFISAEKAEIALMKAMGISNKAIVWYHTLRFTLVALAASLVAAALCLPATHLIMNPIFGIMGAVSGVIYEIIPFEIFVVYPVILVAVAIVAAFLTSLYTNTIKSSDASNIE